MKTKKVGVKISVSQHEVFKDALSKFLEDINKYILREKREIIFVSRHETYYVRHVYLYISLDVWEKIKNKYSEVKHYNDTKEDYDYFLVNYNVLENDELKRIKKKGNKIVAYAYVMDYEENQKAIRAFEDYIIEKRYIIRRKRDRLDIYDENNVLIRDFYIEYTLKLTLREWEDLLHRYKDLIRSHQEFC